MGTLVILDFDGDLHQGVAVTLEIRADGDRTPNHSPAVIQTRAKGKLPPSPELINQYEQWRSLYRSLSLLFRLGDRPNPVTRGSKVEMVGACRQAAAVLASGFNQWLRTDAFRTIRERLLEKLAPDESIRLIVQAEDDLLRRLPWHGWDLLHRFPKAEVALSAPAYERIERSTPVREQVRILAVLGDRTGIDIERDRQLLTHLPGHVETVFLVEPDRQQLQQHLWDATGWDILFFAGHSTSHPEGETGYLDINPHDRLSLEELTYGLKKAIARGLQLAIFNSCDGLGLARQLERLQIPQMIVMREPVPDRVAQSFLNYFLTSFSAHQPFYEAVRDAREQLQSLEDQYPCATWLPIICQNPTVPPLSWFRGEAEGRRQRVEGGDKEDKGEGEDRGDREASPHPTPHTPHPTSNPQSNPQPPTPYLGLSAFQESDASFFFGREALTEKLTGVLQHQPFVAIIGPSGSGKSSLVFAGLVPRLRSQHHWQVITIRPGNRPFFRLAEQLIAQLEPALSETDQLVEINKLAIALRNNQLTLTDVAERILQKSPAAKRLLLVADQFEELYTLCQDGEERQQFLTTLLSPLEALPTLSLVLTLRADFCEYALAYRPLADALQRFPPELLGPMTHAELRAAIEQPAAQLGVTYADGLIERMLDAVEMAPGHLPLLEFALTLLWDKQSGRCLTHAAYDAIGGVERALASYAEQIYSGLDAAAQQQAQQIFTQLVRPGEGTADTRRLASRDDIGEANWPLVTRLADARLVVSRQDEATGGEMAEIAHEALIQEWQRLRQWLEDDRRFRTWQERLRSTLRQWETSQRDEGALLRGAPLLEAQHWLQTRAASLSETERQFIKTSLTLKKQEQSQRDRQRRFRVMGLSSGLTAALLLTGVAVWQWHRAEIVQANAQLDSLSTSADELFASGKELEALIEGLRAAQQLSQLQNPNPDTRTHVVTSLLQVVYGVREFNRFNGHTRTVISATFSPDGQLIASASDDHTVRLWRQDGTPIATLVGHRDRVRSVAFSPDGQIIASASYDKTIRLWRRDGKAIAVLTGHTAEVNSVSFSPDGQLLASASADGTIKLWQRTSSGFAARPALTIQAHRGWVSTVSFSPDGQWLISAGTDDTIRLWQRNGIRIASLAGFQSPVNSLSLSPDGQLLAAGLKNGTVLLWQRRGASFTAIRQLQAHGDRVWGVSFSPDGQTIATASADNTIKLWQRDGMLITTLEGHNSSVYSVSFSPDGTILASTSADSTIRLWRPHNPQLAVWKGHPNHVTDIRFSPDGQQVATASGTEIKLWSTNLLLQSDAQPFPLNTLSGHSETVNRLSFSPDGQLLASASNDTTIKLWQRDGTLLQTLQDDSVNVSDVSFSPDGHLLAAADEANLIRLWQRPESGQFDPQSLQSLAGHADRITAITFSPDGQTLASGSADNTVKLWHWQQGRFATQPFRTLTHSSSVTAVSFSPDGQLIASATADGNGMIWRWDGKLLANLKGHRDRITRILFSPDGQTIATASADGTIKLWNVRGALLRTLKGHSSRLQAMSFSPSGQTLAAADSDGNLILWDFSLSHLLEQGCGWIDDYLRTNADVSEGDRHLCDVNSRYSDVLLR